MRMRALGLAAGAALLGGLLAPDANADDAYERCVADNETNSGWSRCGGEVLAREDARLNAAWQQVFGRQTGQTKRDLLAEQRAWNAYKETSCRYFANGDFGREGAVLSYPACRAGVIADRTKALKGMFEEDGR